MGMSVIEAELRSLLEKVSNGEQVDLSPQAVEDLGEQVKSAVIKQFTPRDKKFKLRPSNIGRPLCQLQAEQGGAVSERMPYNHVIRMLVGDCVEAIVRLLLTTAGVGVTSDGDRVGMKVNGLEITGDSDIDIHEKVYDIKSCSPFAFQNKWQLGYEALEKDDPFGYIGQLYLYADAQKKDAGGWIVVDKSSGEIAVVEVHGSNKEKVDVRKKRRDTVKAVVDKVPFRRGFEAEDEFFRKKRTGDKVLHKSCRFCSFKKSCWPTATFRPSKMSNPDAKNPAHKWFVD